LGDSEDAILLFTTAFYNKVFEDPILNIFFIGNDKKHAERLALFLLYVMNISNKYIQERYSVDMVETSHYMSKFYQERLDAPAGAGYPGGSFTNSQVSNIIFCVLFFPYSNNSIILNSFLENSLEKSFFK